MWEWLNQCHYCNSHIIVSSVVFCDGDMMRRGDMHERAGMFYETDPILGTFGSAYKFYCIKIEK